MNDGSFFPYLVDKPLTEDGFYMMTVAWNIAEGDGIKYNLNRPTTGIQPLVTFIQAGVAKIVLLFGGAKIMFLRVMILFSALLIFIFSLAAGSIVQKLIPSLYSQVIVIILVLFNFDLLESFTNGLETGFYLLMIAVCVNYSFRFIDDPNYKSAFIFGLLAGVTTLTRIDFLLPLLFYLIILFLYRKINPVKLVLILLVAVVILLPWLLYVYDVSGSIFPSSVSAQTKIIGSISFIERLSRIVEALLVHLSPFVYSHNVFISAAAVAVNGFIFYYLLKHFNLFKAIDKPSFINLLCWGISFFLLALTYFAYSEALHFYIRYLTSFYLFIILFTINCLLFILDKLPSFYRKLILPFFILFFFLQSFYYLFNGKVSSHLVIRIAYIQNNFSETDRIGLFQSGVTGFFLENVINLDGKVDHVLHSYAAQNKFEEFLDSMQVNVIIEWKKDFNVSVDENYFSKNWKIFDEDIGDGTTSCFIRKEEY